MTRRTRDKGLPPQLAIGGQAYKPAVLLVTGRDAFGRPKEATFLHDEESVEVRDGLEFLVVYAVADCLRKRS